MLPPAIIIHGHPEGADPGELTFIVWHGSGQWEEHRWPLPPHRRFPGNAAHPSDDFSQREQIAAWCASRPVLGYHFHEWLPVLDRAGIRVSNWIETADWARIAFPGRASYQLDDWVGDGDKGQLSPAAKVLHLSLAIHQALAELPAGVQNDLAQLFGGEWLAWGIASSASGVSPLDRPETEAGAKSGCQPLPASWEPVELLGPAGPIARQFPHFEMRESQNVMMAAVQKSMSDGSVLLVEAGTGTGKSLAYLVPAVVESARRGERVVIATHTLALQEQLWGKDLPPVQSAVPVQAALVKGKGRYLCLLKLDETRRQTNPLTDDRERRLVIGELITFACRTESGDVDAFNPRGPAARQLWEEVVADRHACRGPRCPYAGPCFLRKSRRSAEESHVVVVNHALLAAHLAQGGVLPEFGHIIIDEAHHFNEAAERAFGFDLGLNELAQSLLDLLRGPNGNFFERLKYHPDLFLSLDRLAERLSTVATLALAAAQEFLSQTEWGEYDRQSVRLLPEQWNGWAETALGQTYAQLQAVAHESAQMGLDLWALAENVLGSAIHEDVGWLRFQKWLEEFCRTAEGIEQWAGSDEKWVDWWVADRRLAVRICRAPLAVGDFLRRTLWERVDSAVLTSATLSVGGNFDFVGQSLGIPAERRQTLRLPSPFDYRRQARLFIPNDLDEVDGPAHLEDIVGFIEEVARHLGGRTLVLLNSHRMLRRLSEQLRPRLWAHGIETLAQGIEGSGARVVQQFVRTPRAVLLGVASLWEGLDVPGPQLSVVMMVRLPFQAPGDPLESARQEQLAQLGKSPFYERSLPQAILKFQQGFGRLLRKADDRGVVVVLDRRILPGHRRYGSRFLQTVRPTPVMIGGSGEILMEIRRFFDG